MHQCQKGVVHINHAFSGVHLLSAMLVVSGAGAPGWPCTKSAAVNLLAVTQEALLALQTLSYIRSIFFVSPD
jgi:hypothetical protein